jgi:hypothetical protein
VAMMFGDAAFGAAIVERLHRKPPPFEAQIGADNGD